MEKNTVKAIPFITNIPTYINAVVCFRNVVYVSGHGDKLIVYKQKSDEQQPSTLEPTIYNNYFGCKSAASDMIVDSMHELLLCRTTLGVMCVDLNDISHKTLISDTKNCTCMCLRVDCSKLCIGVRKNTLVLSYSSSMNTFRFQNFIPSKETPLCMEWFGKSLFVGCKIAYYLQDPESCSITKSVLTKCTKTSTSMMCLSVSAQPEMVLLDSDNTLVMIDKQGNINKKNEPLRITTQPSQLVSLFPYIFVIVDNFVYIYNAVTLKRIQRIPIQGQFRIIQNDNIAEAAFLLYSHQSIYHLGLLAPEDQVKLLLSQSPPLFEQSLSVACNHDLGEHFINDIHFKYGSYLFNQSLFEEAMREFVDSGCDVRIVLGLFKELRFPGDLPVPDTMYPLPILSGAACRRAYEALTSYLHIYRSIVLKGLSLVSETVSDTNHDGLQSIIELIDDSIVITLIALQAADRLQEFLLNPNNCNVPRIEERLVISIQQSMTEKSRLVFSLALLYLFEGKQQYKRAVEVVLFQLQQYNEMSPERTQLVQILTRVLYGLDASDESLVFKCSERIYTEAPDQVLRCFIDEDGMIGHLNIYHVVQHLQKLSNGEDTVYKRNRLALEYLNVVTPHITSAGNTISKAPLDHNLSHMLAELYIDTLKDLLASGDVEVVQKLRDDLKSLLLNNFTYVPDLLIKSLPENELLEERCIILSRMNGHEEAMQIMLYKLKDLEGVYSYCERVIGEDKEKNTNAYVTLVSVLINPLKGTSEELCTQYSEEAYRLLDRYHEKINPELIMNLFADSTPFHKLYPYTAQATTQLTEMMYNTRMKYNLTMSDYTASQHIVAKTRQNGVEVDENSLCDKCGKPLGTSAIVWVSDSLLYHYTCCEINGDSLLVRDKHTGMVEKIKLTDAKI